MCKQYLNLDYYIRYSYYQILNLDLLSILININSMVENLIKQHYDISIHPLLPYLYLFKYNNDNIGHILHETSTNTLIGFDFGENIISSQIIYFLETELKAKFKHLFTTHFHNDHSGGNEKWKKDKTDSITIYCSNKGDFNTSDYIDTADKRLDDNEEIIIGDISIKCMQTPGHVKTHCVYIVKYIESKSKCTTSLLFSGDTLFPGSVGKVFNGSHKELYNSILRIFSLPGETIFFAGHEYTINNLKFNLSIDKENDFIKKKLDWADDIVKKGLFTSGTTLNEERKYNAFIRTSEDKFLKLTNEKDSFQAFIKIRDMKDKW